PRLHVHRPPAAREVAGRGRDHGVRGQLGRLAGAGRDRRDAVRGDPHPGHPADDPVHPARGGGRDPARRGRAVDRAEPVRAAGHLPGRVRAGRVRVPGGRPGRGPGPAGGVLLGLSCGVKWSGIWFLIGFGLLSVLWDVGARRAAGMSRPWQGTALRDLPGAAGSFVLAPVAAYLLSWSGWFLGENSYDRHWADTHTGYWSWLPGPIRSLLNYHAQMWDFHSTLRTPHSYQSSPW